MGEDVNANGIAGPALLVAPGPRALEALLLERVAACVAEARQAPQRLALPARIVVPSRSLADHVADRIVAHVGHSVAGVLVQTLHALAFEVLERAGVAPPASDALFPVLVRRLAAEEPLLRERLGDLVDGFAAVEASVADLLDAGFDADVSFAVFDALETADAYPAARETALAVARVAGRCLDAMRREGIGHRAVLLREAREALVRDPDAALPARAVWIHGFADATGLRAELIEELVRHRAASVLLDAPPDPSQPGEPDAGARFAQRLRDRLLLIGRESVVASTPLRRLTLECVEAARPDGEVREVAARVRAALDAGERPEGIGVVARDLTSFRAPLSRHFARLGIPFSGGAEGGVGSRTRHVRALERLLREQEECRVESWLDARDAGDGAVDASDLRLGLHRLGIVRLSELAAHRHDGGDVKLPVVAGWWSDSASEVGETVRALRRRLRAAVLASAVAGGRATCARLARLRAGGTCTEQLDELSGLLRRELGWKLESEAWEPVRLELDALRHELPSGFRLTLEDLVLLVRRRIVPCLAVALGGRGGGVQVLDVTAARGRTFERLFVMGLARDVFPRSVREDPLLPDRLRERVRGVLPDVPVKKLGHDEERFLFAELVAAAPHVTLSRPLASDEGRPCAGSSFVERLRWGKVFEKAVAASSVLAPTSGGPALRLSLEEHALRAALFGPPARLEAVLPAALRVIAAEILRDEPVSEAGPLAAARLAVLREAEGQPFRGSPRLGPYFGFVGSPRAAKDPRQAPLYVTTLERLSRCGWQTFLARLLRLEAPPDAGGTLPGVDKRLLGLAVHRAIDGVFGDVADAAAAPERARAALWPDEARLAAITSEAAAAVLADEGVALRGLARVLAQRALPYVLRARDIDRAETRPLEVVAVEHERRIDVSDARGRSHALLFRADRIERIGEGERLTDFKTGKPISDASQESTRRKHFMAAIARGAILQPVAYARTAQGEGAGRLLYLRPDLAVDAVEFSAPRGDAELGRAFDSALTGLFDAWHAGSFFPRMLDEDLDESPQTCQFCDVAQACLRDDTNSRRRLAAWIEANEDARAGRLAGAERALLDLFRLGAAPDAEAEDAS